MQKSARVLDHGHRKMSFQHTGRPQQVHKKRPRNSAGAAGDRRKESGISGIPETMERLKESRVHRLVHKPRGGLLGNSLIGPDLQGNAGMRGSRIARNISMLQKQIELIGQLIEAEEAVVDTDRGMGMPVEDAFGVKNALSHMNVIKSNLKRLL